MNECKYQKEVEAIIVKGDAKILVETAQQIAVDMNPKNKWGKVTESASVSTSQIRNIYGTSKKIEMAVDEKNSLQMYNRLLLLKPKMAYANGRFNKKVGANKYKIPGFKVLIDCLSYAIDKVDGDFARMQHFFNFFEAILAYHRAEGGR
ncbi:MAG: type III-A CRISPR-associated protein Csm2 [Deltaproteobacteria bacterium]|nr:type III-A CRISPR-associated protein Csm2 [Deltaproteobacteria bacterium]MBW2049969.1 type III-A CRISPR-associated protein Csm2 [Deltaproteobacteria bacterium]